MEIKEKGWAFGQIADMEAWYRELKADPTKVGSNNFTVTGYSLGGHLATAFGILRREEQRQAGTPNPILNTYTINGAGVGTFTGTLGAAERIFVQRRPTGANADLFTTTAAQNFYNNNKTIFQARASLTTQASAEAALNQLILPMQLATGVGLQELTLLQTALRRVSDIAKEIERVNAGIPNGGVISAPAQPTVTTQIDAIGLDYQLAVLKASETTASTRTVADMGGVVAYSGRAIASDPLANLYDLYGDTSPSGVSNSQIHYGTPTPVWIEDQPLLRGTVESSVLDASGLGILAADLKLLVPNFSLNDFGDTHSLVLLVDSLSVQNALCQLDTTLGETASRGKLKALLDAASNTKVETGFVSSVGVNNQGKADGDSLEALVNALGTYLAINSDTKWVQLKGNPNGGTWAKIRPSNESVGADGITDRSDLHNNLKLITDDADYQALLGKVQVKAISQDFAKTLSTVAKTDFGAIAALEALSPFILTARAGTDGQSKLDSLWQGAWSEQYKGWQDDATDRASAVRGGPSGGVRYYSDNWLADRAAMLEKLIELNNGNIDPLIGNTSGINGKNVFLEDRYTGIKFQASDLLSTNVPYQYLFGTDDAETDLVGRVGEDHIYAGGGDDTIDSGDGNDKLYGDAGADTIQGGSGNDEIHGGADSDTLDGGADTDTLYGEAGNDRLGGGAGDDLLYGDVIDPNNTSAIGNDTLIGGDGRDTLYGGQGDDTLYGDQESAASLEAFGWGDKLYGGAGKDTLYGGSGSDTLDVGEGDDTLTGGDGNDSLQGGAGNDTYQFQSMWGKDTITDTDGQGSIQIDGVTIGYGVANGKGWAFDMGNGNYAGMAVYQDVTSSTGKKLIITKGAGSANTIIVNNFDYDAATTGSGYLGIKLDNESHTAKWPVRSQCGRVHTRVTHYKNRSCSCYISLGCRPKVCIKRHTLGANHA